MKILLLAGCAGFIGTLMRYGIVRTVTRCCPGFPWGTLTVNIIGAFLAGFFYVFCREKWSEYAMYFPILFLGFLGAFTTFSSFMLDSMQFFAAGQYLKFAANVLVQNVTGCFAVVLGVWIARRILL